MQALVKALNDAFGIQYSDGELQEFQALLDQRTSRLSWYLDATQRELLDRWGAAVVSDMLARIETSPGLVAQSLQNLKAGASDPYRFVPPRDFLVFTLGLDPQTAESVEEILLDLAPAYARITERAAARVAN